MYELGNLQRNVPTHESEELGLPLESISSVVNRCKAEDPFLVDDEYVIDESILPGPDGRDREFRHDLVNPLQITRSLCCHRVRDGRGQIE